MKIIMSILGILALTVIRVDAAPTGPYRANKEISDEEIWKAFTGPKAQTTNTIHRDNSFMLLCETGSPVPFNSEIYHIDPDSQTVNGKTAKISDEKIIFSKNGTLVGRPTTSIYTINRYSGLLDVTIISNNFIPSGPPSPTSCHIISKEDRKF